MKFGMRSFSWWKWVFMQIRKVIVSSFKKGDQKWFMRGSRNFRQLGGGGDGVQVNLAFKKSSDDAFLFLFFSPQLILQKSSGFFHRKLLLPRFQWGWNIFQGDPTFNRGVQLLFPYRNPYNLWFSRGSGPPAPLSGSAHVIPRIVVWSIYSFFFFLFQYNLR